MKKQLFIVGLVFVLLLLTVSPVQAYIDGCSETESDYHDGDNFDRADNEDLGNTEISGAAYTDNNGQIVGKAWISTGLTAESGIVFPSTVADEFWFGVRINITSNPPADWGIKLDDSSSGVTWDTEMRDGGTNWYTNDGASWTDILRAVAVIQGDWVIQVTGKSSTQQYNITLTNGSTGVQVLNYTVRGLKTANKVKEFRYYAPSTAAGTFQIDEWYIANGTNCPSPPTPDTTNPAWIFNSNKTNFTTIRHKDTGAFNVTIVDETTLTGGSCTFGWKENGTWANYSCGNSPAGITTELTTSKQIGGVVNSSISWQYYFSDGNSNANKTVEFSFTVGNTAPNHTIIRSPPPNKVDNQNMTVVGQTYDIDANIVRCELWSNVTGNFKQEGFNSSITNSVNFSITHNATNDDNFTYFLKCIDGGGLVAYSQNRSFGLDTTDPTITLNAGNEWNISNYSQFNPFDDTFNISITFTDERDLYAYSINVTQGTTSLFNITSSTLSGTSYTYANSFNIAKWGAGIYNIKVMVSDSHTAKEIKPYQINKQNRLLGFHTAEGNYIQVDSDDDAITDTIKQKDRYEFEFDFKDGLKKDRTFHVRSDQKIIYRSNSKYKAHFIIFNGEDGNWVDFEGVAGKPTVLKISDNHYTVTFQNLDKKVKFKSIGGLNIVTAYYSWYRGNTSVFAPDGLTNESNFIYLNATTNAAYISSINSELVYNSVFQDGNTKTSSSTLEQFKDSITSPATEQNITYYWVVNVTQPDGRLFTFNVSGTHKVYAWGIGSCNTYSTTALILSLFDEQTPANKILGTMEVDASVFITDRSNSQDYNANFNALNDTFVICKTAGTLWGDFYIKYTVPTGFTHRYYLYNHSINAVPAENISIFNYNATTGTSNLEITARLRDTYEAFAGVVGKLERFYPAENIWRTVQMDLTGDYGLLFFNVREEDTDYRLTYLDTNNNELYQTASLKFVCTSGVCAVTSLLEPYTPAVLGGVTPTYTFDNTTKILTVNWVAISSTSQVSAVVTHETMSQSTLICNNGGSGTSGIITCDVTGYEGVIYLKVNSTVGSTQSQHIGTFIEIGSVRIGNFIKSKQGAFWSFILMLPIVMFGLVSPVMVIVVTIFGLVVIYFLGLTSAVSYLFVITAAVMGLVIAFKVKN